MTGGGMLLQKQKLRWLGLDHKLWVSKLPYEFEMTLRADLQRAMEWITAYKTSNWIGKWVENMDIDQFIP